LASGKKLQSKVERLSSLPDGGEALWACFGYWLLPGFCRPSLVRLVLKKKAYIPSERLKFSSEN